ncbi:chemotaxis protein CheW [Shewanella intestini]|uniref:Chemotaxis protein CheW n=1 Tax=Shewanella intestini TaxID=2017544 RepID=A0ABS5HZZ4_9GAMM|nr:MULTISPECIES: chemotaxis protein CheW [Shewanella]MBR9727350.1 chemotaxis protein CheW [Shewanella intestini]MRG35600.1 chemotaxis protein CheW [Shewanella sp. XMDDZSB0408]
MSKSVDETVFDYFNLLLQEPTSEVAEIVAPKETPTAVTIEAKKSIESRADTNKQTDNNDTKIAHGKSDSSDKRSQLTQQQNVVNSQQRSIGKKNLAHQVDALTTNMPKVEPVDIPNKGGQSKPFEQPPVDKASLARLLSAVSAPIETSQKPAASAVEQPSEFEKKIHQSAQKVKQAIAAQALATQKTKNTQLSAQKLQTEDKETKSLVDNKQDEISPSQPQKAIDEPQTEQTVKNATQADVKTSGSPPANVVYNLKEVLDDEFQVLFFNIAGLTLAVPLVSLGGIVKVERINNIIGRPKWFLGVQPHREGQVNVVDSCAWVMPEKYTSELQAEVDYQYIVMLEDSDWGLACESLVNSVKIDKSHVNWREKPGKRPWLAGVVKEQMCGIIHVQALIQMLEAGLGSQDSIDRG